MLLAAIPHIGKTAGGCRSEIHLDLLERSAPALFEHAELFLGIGHIQLFEPNGHGLDNVVFQVGIEHSVGAEVPGMIGDDDRANAQLARDIGTMQRPRPAIGDHGEVPGVMSPLDGRHLDGGRHRQGRDVNDAGGDAVQGLVQSRCKLADGLLRRRLIELDLTIEEAVRMEAT